MLYKHRVEKLWLRTINDFRGFAMENGITDNKTTVNSVKQVGC
jgi:hypothetical protein